MHIPPECITVLRAEIERANAIRNRTVVAYLKGYTSGEAEFVGVASNNPVVRLLLTAAAKADSSVSDRLCSTGPGAAGFQLEVNFRPTTANA